MSYITIQDIFDRYDKEDVRQLLSDNPQPAETVDLASNPPTILLSLIQDAAGIFEGYLFRGNRYLVTDLEGLTGNSLALLKRINCDLFMWLLMQRRPDREPERIEAQEAIAMKNLRALAKGEAIFGIPAVAEAGTQHLTGPTVVDIQNLNLVVDHCRPHYYPRRRLPRTITRD